MFYLLIVVAAASRFLPHPPNVACVAALSLFAGSCIAGRRAYLVPLAVMLLSDLVGQGLGWPGFGFYSPIAMICVYAGMLAAVPLGRWLNGRRQLWRYPAASLAASTLFFLISNFGVWLSGSLYTLSAAGLLACYVAALPFYGYTLVGDMMFTTVVFAAWEFSRRESSRSKTWVELPACQD